MESRLMEPITDIEKMFALYAKLFEDMRDIKQHLASNIIDIDEFTGSPITPQTVFTPPPATRLPIVVEYVLAVFPTTTTSAFIQLGPERTIPITNPAQGYVNLQLRMQLEYEDVRSLTIAPAGIGFLEIMGHAVTRQRDRP